MKLKKRHKYLNKIILIWFSIIYTIVLLILLASVAFIQKKNNSIIQEQEKTLFKRRVSDYETVYTDMFNISNDIKEMTNVDLFALASGRTYYSAMADVQKEIRKYSQQYQRNGYRIIIHRLNDNKMITEQETADRQYLLPQIGLTPAQYSELLNELVHYNKKHLLLFTDDRLTYMTCKSYMNHNIVIVINCPVNRIATEENDAHLFTIDINDDNVKDLRVRERADFHPEIPDSFPDDTIVSSKMGNKLCLQMRSRSYDIIYNALSPIPVYASLYRVMLYLTLILIFAFIPIFLMVARVSKWIYRPIDRLISTVSSGDSSEESENSDEMDFLLGHVKNIQVQNKELIHTVDIHKQLVKQGILIKLLSNSYNPSTIRATLEKSGISWLNTPCFLIIFDMPLQNHKDIMPQVNMVDVLDHYFSKGRTCIYTEMSESGICCVLPTAAEAAADSDFNIHTLSELQQYLHEVLLTIEKEAGYTLASYIAPQTHNLNTLSSSYNIATFMKEEASRLPFKNIYIYKDYEQLFKTSMGYPFSIERDLIYAAGENDWNSVEKIIDEIFDIYISKTFYEKSLREMNIISLINTINRSIQKASLSINDLLSHNQYLFLELKMSSTSQELCNRIKDIYRIILAKGEKNQSLRTEDFGQQLKQYIVENYSRDISLNDIADHFSLSPNYMSLVFKKTLDSTFKEYLNRFRCEKAKELLRQPDIRVAEVSAMVGIANVNTFIRIFKKDCGISPGQYQAQLKK